MYEENTRLMPFITPYTAHTMNGNGPGLVSFFPLHVCIARSEDNFVCPY